MSVSSISTLSSPPTAAAAVVKPHPSPAQPASKPVAAPAAIAPAHSDAKHDGSSGGRINVKA